MLPKPAHLAPEYGEQFKDSSVAASYRYRPPYPDETFHILSSLIPAVGPRSVLDAGCGTGFVARPLALLVDRVDAVDFSEAMLDEGKRLPGGDAYNLRWLQGPMESVPLDPPYGLLVAGASLQWVDWQAVFPRFHDVLAPGGYLAIVEDHALPLPWRDALAPIITRYSTNREYQPYDIIDELQERHLFTIAGVQETNPVPFVQPVEHYIESFHARNGFSRDRMTREAAAAFDREAAALVSAFCPDGAVRLDVLARVTWGLPTG